MILFSIFLWGINLSHVVVSDSLIEKLTVLSFISFLYIIFKLYLYSKKHIDAIIGLYRVWVFFTVNIFPPFSILIYVLARFALPAVYAYVASTLLISAMVPMYLSTQIRPFLLYLGAILLLFDHSFLFRILFYRHTAYYKQTKIPRRKVLTDKGAWGEFFAYMCFEKDSMPKQYIFGAMVPKWNHPEDFAEIDMIVLSQRGIQVVEVKNRTGVFSGKILSPNWTQTFDNGTSVEMDNPVLQNQNHIIALTNYLAHHGFCFKSEMDNIVFLSNLQCAVEADGSLGTNMYIADQFCLRNTLRGLQKTEEVMTDEERELVLELLSDLSPRTPAEHEARIARRSNYLASSVPMPTYYFVETEYFFDGSWHGDTFLYRYNSFGLSKLDQDHFWHPLGDDVVSNDWLKRLPYCNQDYSDLTSFQQAQKTRQALEAAMSHVLPTLPANLTSKEISQRLQQEANISSKIFYTYESNSGSSWFWAPIYSRDR